MKLGFDIEKHRQDAQRRQERSEDVRLKEDANDIARRALETNRNLSIWAIRISGVSLLVAILALFLK